ncbi:MAG: hypothetical protein ACRDJE_14325 [Dehalococcoidia bacterium]
MHAMIRRYDGVTGSSDDLMRFGRREAAALSEIPGFVSYALLEAGGSVLMAVCIFETQAALEAAERLDVFGVDEPPATLASLLSQVARGEVIVQRGM